MATPHHIPALPTAAPVTVGLRGIELVRSSGERLLLRRVRQRVAAGDRRLELILGAHINRARLALAAALDIGGRVLVLTQRASRRRSWRQAFLRLGQLDAQEAPVGVQESIASLTCITFAQLSALQSSDDANVQTLARLDDLAVVILDTPRLRRQDRALVAQLIDSYTVSPVLIGLPGRLDQPSGLPDASRVYSEPGLQVKAGRIAPYQSLFWLSRPENTTLAQYDRDVLCARAIIDRLAHPLDIEPQEPDGAGADQAPTLTRFIAQSLPQTDPGSSRRHAYLSAFTRNPTLVAALVRTHLALGGELPVPVRALLSPSLNLHTDQARPSQLEWGQVLYEYGQRLRSRTDEASLHRRELCREALSRLGFGSEKRKRGKSRIQPTRGSRAHLTGTLEVLQHERLERPEARAVVLVDVSRRGGFGTTNAVGFARELVRHQTAAVAVLPSGLWMSDDARDRLLRAIRPHHPAEDVCVSDDGMIRFVGEVDWNPVIAWAVWAMDQAVVNTVVCAPEVLPQFARHASATASRPVAHLVVDARSRAIEPTVLTANHLLEPSHAGGSVVNLWRIVPFSERSPAGFGALEEALAADELVASPTDDGRLRYGRSELRRLLESRVSPAHIQAFNQAMLKRSQRRALARESWREVSGRRHVIPAIEVRKNRASDRPLTQLTGGGAAMSEIRARHRYHKLIHGRRHLIAQTIIGCVIAGLLLPTVAGPVLGSLVALLTIALSVVALRRDLRAQRLATLSRPESQTAIVRDIACVVLRTLRSCEGIPQAQLPTSRIKCSEGPYGDLALWLDVDDPRLARLFADAVSEALDPIVAHRYIIGRPETRVPAVDDFETYVASYHPVPSIFGSRRQRAELYAGHWAQVFGSGKLRYTAGGKGRLLRFAHFGRNHLGLDVQRVAILD